MAIPMHNLFNNTTENLITITTSPMTKRPYQFSTPVFVGIDPQQKFISVNVTLEDGTILAWFNHVLKRKQSSQFATAQSWQEYIFRECHNLLQTVVYNQIKPYQNVTISRVGIEQQKGRVNTIIEQTLLCVCLILKIPATVLHPVTWKKKTGIQCMGSNHANKKECVEKTRHILVGYFGEAKVVEMENTDDKRIHDYCDAYRIGEALRINLTYNSKQSSKEKAEWAETSPPSSIPERKLETNTPIPKSTGITLQGL